MFERITTIILVLMILTGFFLFLEERDRQVIKSSELYESCVRKEYKTTPSAWYMEYGYYPECTFDD